ncbi:hypothetical protein CC80DRAFT_519749 [Byssothecium circinans]|uniref:Pre-mRNA polyadenylation factor Fip1 domain-containing protein n=1 Tax=Byssothecium circinans TaxID=147558 RepID=A0A6A5TGN9_9PLEO|nr:hypothetical protein CC80DRAFT_519749 [Byssothecium circinans]
MDEEDDDLYGPSETAAPAEAKKEEEVKDGDASEGDEPMDEGDESGEEDSSGDDSDDVEIIIDRPPEAPKPAQPAKPVESKAIKIEAPPQQTSTPSQASRGIVPQLQGQPGTAYPAVKSSTIDVNADPTYSPLGKPISQVDIDADLAEASKPWRLPGADQSDYFNYGFDEFTWEMYRQRQQTMADTLTQQKAETAQLQSFFGQGMGPGGGNPVAAPPNAPAGPAAGAAGPPAGPMGAGMMNEEMIQQAMAQMMQNGIDPSTMDFNAFMQMAGGGGSGFGGDQQQQQQQQQGGYGGGGGGGRGGRRGGRGRGGW